MREKYYKNLRNVEAIRRNRNSKKWMAFKSKQLNCTLFSLLLCLLGNFDAIIICIPYPQMHFCSMVMQLKTESHFWLNYCANTEHIRAFHLKMDVELEPISIKNKQSKAIRRAFIITVVFRNSHTDKSLTFSSFIFCWLQTHSKLVVKLVNIEQKGWQLTTSCASDH